MAENEQSVDLDFAVGDLVEVLEGPFAHFQGKVEEILATEEKIKVTVDMFGRETTMELAFDQVLKV